MKQRPVLDVSELPSVVFGSRAPIWWGVVGLLAIEGTVFALLAATYFYLRGGASEWPPPGVAQPSLALTTTGLAILLASIVPMHWTNKAAERGELGRIQLWLSVTTLLGIVFLAMRVAEFRSLSYEWRSHAYGSVVWTVLAIHTLHVLTSVGENTLFLTLLWRGPVEDKHLTDVTVNGLYWYFVALSWLPFYVLFYLDPGLFRP
jgi:heme/copper-type cytochrome/quinol oxidase subunit 3